MIDIHSHILYDIDDGSRSLEMSLEMLRLSVASEVTDIFATPHVNRRGVVPSWEMITQKVEVLQAEADKADIPIRIHAGAEVELNYDALKFLLENERQYCLAESRYILCEFTNQSEPRQAEKLLYELMLRGFVPILAHPERYERIMTHPRRVLEWMHNGVLAQCNTGSFRGSFGKEVQGRAEELLDHDMVIFLGSDAHRVEMRNTDLREAEQAIDAVDKKHDLWEKCEDNAQRILTDRVLYPTLPDQWNKPKKGLLRRLFGG